MFEEYPQTLAASFTARVQGAIDAAEVEICAFFE